MEELKKEQRFCEGHLELSNTLVRIEERQIAMDKTINAVDKRINGSIDTIEKHIDNSRGRNFAIVLAFVGVITWLLTQGIAWGESKRQIQINTERWNYLIQGKMPK